ncbi:hypothetical protein MMC30_000278 [Trapelia coarctata]|nr:hypothetical protein [Trapelia coarctata]
MAASVDAKLLKQTKFPPEFSQKVDMNKVNVEVMKKWIAGKISEILGNEDDVVIELCFNLLEGARFPDIKVLQIQLTGFLDKDTAKFCKELWNLCLSAQSNPQGVPKELLEAKKLELIQEKIDAEKAAEEARLRQEQEKLRDRNIDNIRQRERGERGRGRGRGEVQIMIAGLLVTPDLRHLDTHTYRTAAEAAAGTSEEDAHHPPNAPSLALALEPAVPHVDAATRQADPHHQPAAEEVMEEGEGHLIVVMIAQDP